MTHLLALLTYPLRLAPYDLVLGLWVAGRMRAGEFHRCSQLGTTGWYR
jgi:hypothetical protein